MNTAGIYIHIPFCVKKCNYCDFLSWTAGEEEQNQYTRMLIQEIEMADRVFPGINKVDTIFIGGGTPSILSARNLDYICEAIYQKFSVCENTEFTIECNPGTAELEKMKQYKKMGINRISFGVQSTCDKELKELGRIHSFKTAQHSLENAREVGFQNINIDIMSAIPKQTLKSYSQTLENILSLNPEHISAYSLIIEEGTPFYELYCENPPVSEEIDRQMYAKTKEILADNGYERYEISNYAKKGFECKHNLRYWSGGNYAGLGVGASSKWNHVRYKNEADGKQYIEKLKSREIVAKTEEILDKQAEMSEFFILGLRKTKGVSLKEFEERFSVSAESVYGEVVEKFIKEGALIKEGDRLKFSEYGLDVSSYVLCEFL